MHIEIPDGVLPPWLWIAGFVIVAVLLAVAIYFAKKDERKMPLAALFAALSLIVMSVPLGLPVHINLMVLVGIIVGPWWALVVSFIVNLLLASIGHGGVTIIGINTLLLWSQAVFGFYLFRFAKEIIKEKKAALKGVAGGVVTFLSLMASFLLLGGLVFAINLNPEEILVQDHDHGHHHQTDLSNYHEDDHHEEDYHDHHESEQDSHDHHEEDYHEDDHDGDSHENSGNGHHLEGYYDEEISLKAFLVIALPVFLYAAVIESVVVGLAISFISKGKPDLL